MQKAQEVQGQAKTTKAKKPKRAPKALAAQKQAWLDASLMSAEEFKKLDHDDGFIEAAQNVRTLNKAAMRWAPRQLATLDELPVAAELKAGIEAGNLIEGGYRHGRHIWDAAVWVGKGIGRLFSGGGG